MTTENTTTESEKKLRGRKKSEAAQPVQKSKGGRPSEMTEGICDEICMRLSMGQSLNRICFDEHIPARTTVYQWLLKNREFAHKYAQARENQAESFFDEAIDIAREHEDPQKARVIVDTLKWAAGKLKPKKFGDKIEHTVQQDFIPLDELRRRIEESRARRETMELEENKLLGTGEGG